MYNKQVCQNPQQMAKTKKLLFSLLDNPTVNANCESNFGFDMNMKNLIVLKMRFLIFSTIRGLMLF